MRTSIRAFVLASVLLVQTIGFSYAITNGTSDGNNHPYVGLVVFDIINAAGNQVPAYRCSGSLLSSTVFLTLGTCTGRGSTAPVAARVWFSEIVEGNPEYPFSGPSSYEGTPHTYPDFCCSGGNFHALSDFATGDFGVVVLTEPVPVDVVGKYAQLPTAGLVDMLNKNRTKVDLVGYGVQTQLTGGGPPVWIGSRIRLLAQSELVSGDFVRSSEFVRIALNPGGGSGGTCHADSGGPTLLADSHTMLAINSSSLRNYNCVGVEYSERIDVQEILEWINSFLSP